MSNFRKCHKLRGVFGHQKTDEVTIFRNIQHWHTQSLFLQLSFADTFYGRLKSFNCYNDLDIDDRGQSLENLFYFWSCYFYFQQWLLWGLGVKSRCDLKVLKIEHELKIFLSFQVLCKHSFEIKFICFHLKSKSWQPMSWNKLMPLH